VVCRPLLDVRQLGHVFLMATATRLAMRLVAAQKPVILTDVQYFRRYDPDGVLSRVLVAAQSTGTVMSARMPS